MVLKTAGTETLDATTILEPPKHFISLQLQRSTSGLDSLDINRQDEQQSASPTSPLEKQGTGVSTVSEDGLLVSSGWPAAMPLSPLSSSVPAGIKDEQQSDSPTSPLEKQGTGFSTVSEDGLLVSSGWPPAMPLSPLSSSIPAGIIAHAYLATQSEDGVESHLETDYDSVSTCPEPYSGFVETAFSTADKCYFYDDEEYHDIGGGGFGVVEKVYWLNPVTEEMELCVVKSLKISEASRHPDGWAVYHEDALREVTGMCRVAGVQGVAEFRDIIVEPSGAIHLILGFVPGVELATRIRNRSHAVAGLSWQQIRFVVQQLVQVLAGCHRRGLVHGDVKPPNIKNSIDKLHVTLLDFGTASNCDGAQGYNGGTLRYLAPELLLSARSKPPADLSLCAPLCGPAVDCWALGVTALELLTGMCLFDIGTSEEPSEWSGDSCEDWEERQTADVHQEWEEELESSPIHAKFNQRVAQLAEASEEYRLEGVAFLRRLLEPDPRKRMTAREALDHPFLVGTFPDVAPDLVPTMVEKAPPVLKNTFQRLMWQACVQLTSADGQQQSN